MENVISMIKRVKGCQFANILYIADGGIPQKVLGKGSVVTKIVRTNCQLNYSYERAVNNRLEKQGDERDFVAKSLPWGDWVKGQENKLIEYKGKLYLRYYDVANADTKSVWFVNGRIATPEEFMKIVEYLKSTNTQSKTQAEVGLVENQVKPKVIKVENILCLNVNNEEWIRECEWQTFATSIR